MEQQSDPKWIATEESFSIDTTIYGARREWRIPYSIHGKTGLVSLPLDSEQLQFFILNAESAMVSMKPDNVLTNVKLYNRGRVWLEAI